MFIHYDLIIDQELFVFRKLINFCFHTVLYKINKIIRAIINRATIASKITLRILFVVGDDEFQFPVITPCFNRNKKQLFFFRNFILIKILT